MRLPSDDQRIAQAIDDELRLHIEQRTAELKAAGASDETAAAQALREFGDMESARAEIHHIDASAARRASAGSLMASAWRDLVTAVRMLRRRPAFALLAVGMLAVGIGASTAIFSVVNAVLLRPLPYPDADRLLLIWSDLRNRQFYDLPIAPGDLPDIRAEATLVDALTAAAPSPQPLVDDDGEPEQVQVVGVLPNFFTVLGGTMAHGRDFVEEDARQEYIPAAVADTPNQPLGTQAETLPHMLVLSHEFWTRRYGADPAVIGKRVQLGGVTSHIVGVLAPGFELLMPPSSGVPARPGVYRALRINYETASRTLGFLGVIGRLKPGASIEAAQSQLDAISARLRARSVVKEGSGWHLRVERMHDDTVADAKPTVLALMGAVLLVLVIACANVGNLLLVGALARAREMAVRAALGASRSNLIRQALTESVVLAVAGAVIGIVLAGAGTRLLLMLAPEGLPRTDAVGLDASALAFAAAAALLSAGIFGVVPALRASQPAAREALRARGNAEGARQGRALRNGVIIAEVALSFMLLIGSGLMLRSLMALRTVDPGFDSAGLLTALVPNPPLPGNDARLAFKRLMHERLSAIPGVTAVTASSPLPLDGNLQSVRWGPEGALADPRLFQQADAHFVLPGYFEAMRTPVLRGRAFTDDDNRPDALVMVVDDLFAAKAFPGVDPVGRRVLVRARTPEPEWLTVIGVVKHQYQSGLASPGREGVFLTDGFFGHGASDRWAVRSAADPASIGNAVRTAVKSVDPSLAVAEVRPMSQLLARAMEQTRFALILIGVFAAIAVAMAIVGIYGVLSTVVRHRTPEIGVRMALGASPGEIFRMVLRQGLSMIGVGIAVGLAGALLATRLITAMLVDVRPTDVATYAATIALFSSVAILACMLPARRAAQLDPNVALRGD